MKITGTRIDKFLASPPDNIKGVLFFGPDRGLVKERSELLARQYVSDPNDVFATTVLWTMSARVRLFQNS